MPPNARVTSRLNNVNAEPNSIYPTLRVEFEFTNSSAFIVLLTNFTGRLFLRAADQYFLGAMLTDTPIIMLNPGANRTIAFYTSIDHYGLATVERLRANQGLVLLANISCSGQVTGQQPSFQNATYQTRIPKSDWVETLLVAFQFKQVFLLELPKIGYTDYNPVANLLEEATKKLAMGDYPEVLVQCQKALEKTKEVAKSRGLLKDNDIDFSKLIPDSSTAAESLDAIWRKLTLFFQGGGRHIGRNINKEDAEFAILVTYGLINTVSKNTEK